MSVTAKTLHRPMPMLMVEAPLEGSGVLEAETEVLAEVVAEPEPEPEPEPEAIGAVGAAAEHMSAICV